MRLRAAIRLALSALRGSIPMIRSVAAGWRLPLGSAIRARRGTPRLAAGRRLPARFTKNSQASTITTNSTMAGPQKAAGQNRATPLPGIPWGTKRPQFSINHPANGVATAAPRCSAYTTSQAPAHALAAKTTNSSPLRSRSNRSIALHLAARQKPEMPQESSSIQLPTAANTLSPMPHSRIFRGPNRSASGPQKNWPSEYTARYVASIRPNCSRAKLSGPSAKTTFAALNDCRVR